MRIIFVRQGHSNYEKDCLTELVQLHVVAASERLANEDIMMDLRANFEGECSEVGMYLAMARDIARHGKAFEGLLKRYFG